MTLYHAAYLFDLEGFRREINSLRFDLAREDYASLRARAHLVFRDMPQVWAILNDFRYDQVDVKDYDEMELRRLWTLAILAQYLYLCPSIDQPTWEVLIRRKPRYGARNWQVMREGLLAIGWDERDVMLLIEGMSTDYLLRPDLVADPLERLPPSCAWYSIGRTGWLDIQEVRRLLIQLNRSRHDFLSLDPVTLPLRGEKNEPVPDEQVELAFVCATGMLRTADVAGKGLFLAILS